MQTDVSGTEGYAAEADSLFIRYESIPSEQAHAAVLHLLPKPPARVLDIGAGTGRDAAWLARLGHQVVAVEPTAALRIRAMQLHASPAITWIDDSLPDLAVLAARDERFDLVMLTAVLMHLDDAERRRALPNIAARVAPGGMLIMTLRHGAVPPGRRMFEVDAEMIVEPARQLALTLELNRHGESLGAENRAAGVTWTTLAFAKRPREASDTS